MERMLWEICRDAKAEQRLTYQQIADAVGLSVNAVSQYLRGETKSPSVYTVGPICAAIGVSMNDYFRIGDNTSESFLARTEALRLENASLRTQREQMKKSLKMHRITTFIMLGIVAVCVLALLVDILNPAIGWVRAG